MGIGGLAAGLLTSWFNLAFVYANLHTVTDAKSTGSAAAALGFNAQIRSYGMHVKNRLAAKDAFKGYTVAACNMGLGRFLSGGGYYFAKQNMPGDPNNRSLKENFASGMFGGACESLVAPISKVVTLQSKHKIGAVEAMRQVWQPGIRAAFRELPATFHWEVYFYATLFMTREYLRTKAGIKADQASPVWITISAAVGATTATHPWFRFLILTQGGGLPMPRFRHAHGALINVAIEHGIATLYKGTCARVLRNLMVIPCTLFVSERVALLISKDSN